jgi:hypothetical protein
MFNKYMEKKEQIQKEGYAVILANLLSELISNTEGDFPTDLSNYGPRSHQVCGREHILSAGAPSRPSDYERQDHTYIESTQAVTQVYLQDLRALLPGSYQQS